MERAFETSHHGLIVLTVLPVNTSSHTAHFTCKRSENTLPRHGPALSFPAFFESYIFCIFISFLSYFHPLQMKND